MNFHSSKHSKPWIFDDFKHMKIIKSSKFPESSPESRHHPTSMKTLSETLSVGSCTRGRRWPQFTTGWWCNNHLEKYESIGRIIPYINIYYGK
jgi:hypothetical protein